MNDKDATSKPSQTGTKDHTSRKLNLNALQRQWWINRNTPDNNPEKDKEHEYDRGDD